MDRLAVHAVIEPSKDAFKEALAIWLLHLVASDSLGRSIPDVERDLEAEVMKWCCLHPGYWSEQIGIKLLEQSGVSLSDEWEVLFEASRIGEGHEVAEGVSSGAQRWEMVDSTGVAVVDGSTSLESKGSWKRVMMPPTVPIGVVPG
jgi:ribosomal biogenesis protein LAS1